MVAVLLVATLSSSYVRAEESVDDLKARLATSTGNERFEVLSSLAVTLSNSAPAEAIDYGEQALKLVNDSSSPVTQINLLTAIAWAYNNQGNAAAAIDKVERSIELARSSGLDEGLINGFNTRGSIRMSLGDSESAMADLLAAVEISERINFEDGTVSLYHNIGALYSTMENYEKALEYYFKALEYKEEIGDLPVVAMILNNIGVAYRRMNQNETALRYYRRALEIQTGSGQETSYEAAHTLHNIGVLHLEMKSYDQALANITESLRISRDKRFKRLVISGLIRLGEVQRALQRHGAALKSLNEAVTLATEAQENNLLADAHEMLSNVYADLGQYRTSLEHHRLFKELDDSVTSEASRKAVSELEVRFNFEKQRKEIELLKKDAAIQQLKLARHRTVRNSLIATCGLMLVLGGTLYRGYRAKRRAALALTEANAELARQKSELTVALSRIKRLGGLLPICASCKKIRDDQGYWQQIEAYIRDHSEADFSHGICPDCAVALYPELNHAKTGTDMARPPAASK
jgi:adenylate cyclase